MYAALGAPGSRSAGGPVLLGDTAIEAGSDSNVAGQAEAFKTTAAASGALGSLTVYIPTGSVPGRLVAAVYGDTSGHPVSLLASGTLVGPVAGAWNTVNLTTSPQITAGATYWIGILSPVGAGTLSFRDGHRAGATEVSSQTTLSAFPATWTRGASYSDGPVSAYGVAAVVSPDTTPPSTPTGLVASNVTRSGLSLSWNASIDNVGVAGYDVYRNGVKVGTSNGTSATWTGLACGTAYTAAVDGYDAAGNTSPAAQITVNTASCPDTAPPSAPTGLAASGITQTSVSLSWSASTDNVGVAGYDVFRNGVKLGTTATTGADWTGLVCGTTYTAAVDAYDAAGNTSLAAQTTVTTAPCTVIDTTPPSAPGNLVTSGVTQSGFTLSWSASTDNVGVAGYDSFLDGVVHGTAAGTTVTMSGLACGNSYTAAVDAFDAAGNVSPRSQLTVTTGACPDTTPPSPPGALVASAVSQSAFTLSWSASTDNVGVVGYEVFRDGAKSGSTQATSYGFAGLSCGTSYTAAVDAYDLAGNVSAQAQLPVATSPCPDTTPPTVTLTSPASGATLSGVVTITADASDDVGVVGVRITVDGATLGTEDLTAPYSVVWDTGTAANGTHTVGAVARDAAGNVTTTPPISVTVANPVVSTPTPVPAAGTAGVTVGGGFVDASARQVMRTAGNVVYVVAADDNPCQSGGSGVIRVEKGVGSQLGNAAVPTSFVEQDSANHPVSAGNGTCQYTPTTSALFNPDSRLDRNGTIQLAYIDTASGNVYYQTFSTVTDTWGARVVIGTGAQRASGSSWPRTCQVALTLDPNDAPEVVYATSSSSNSLVFTTKAGGVWSPGITIASGTDLMHPSLVTSLDGVSHLTWLQNSLAAHAAIEYARYDGISWSPPELVSSGDSLVLANGDDDQGPSVATDLQSRPHVLFLDGTVNGSDNYVRLRVRTAPGTWVDNTPPGGAGGPSNPAGTWYTHTPQDYISSSGADFVFLGHDVNISPGGYEYQTGGFGNPWSPYATLDPRNKTNTTLGAPGLDGSASIRFDPLRDNNPGIIDLIYYDENDGTSGYPHHATIYYKAVVIGPADTTPPTTPAGLSQTGATATSITMAWSASTDDVGVAGYTLYNGASVAGSSSSTTGTIGGLACATTYSIGVDAYDGAGNRSGRATISATTGACDVQPPTVSITSPAAGAAVSGAVSVSASASDDNAVAGVQFKVDGVNIGAEDATSPYSAVWDSTTLPAGQHALTAVARDTSGNSTTSAPVSVTSQNVGPAFVRDLGGVTAANTGGSLQLFVPSGGVPAGHAIVVWAGMTGSSGVTISSITDSRGNAYTADGAINNQGVNTMVGSGYITTSLVQGDKVTVTFSGSYYSLRLLRAAEFTGLSAAGRVGQKGTATGSSISPASPLVSAQSNELLVGAIGLNSTSGFTPSAGFTALPVGTATASGVTRTVVPLYRLATPAGQYQAKGTLAASSLWSAALLTYH